MSYRNLYLKNNEYIVEVQPGIFYRFDTIANKWEKKDDFVIDSSVIVLSYDEVFNKKPSTLNNSYSQANVVHQQTSPIMTNYNQQSINQNQQNNYINNNFSSHDQVLVQNTPNNEVLEFDNTVAKNPELSFENLAIKNLSYTYKKNNYKSLDNVSINIGAGQFHVFTGDNGAGKSTAIKIIVGIIRDYEGIITVNGVNIVDNPSVKRIISYVSDQTIFPDYFNVFEYLYSFGSNYSKSKSTLKNRINKLLEQFGLQEQKKANPNKLSLGQKKKVLLIRALLERAELIILDEPVANLDPTTKLQILKLLKEIQKKGVAIFVSTHLLDDIKNFATHLTLISKGEIKFTGPVTSDEFLRINYEYFSSKSKEVDLSEVVHDIIGNNNE